MDGWSDGRKNYTIGSKQRPGLSELEESQVYMEGIGFKAWFKYLTQSKLVFNFEVKKSTDICYFGASVM